MKSYMEDTGSHEIRKGTAPALASGAFGKLASAVAQETGDTPTRVMKSVKPSQDTHSEEAMDSTLSREAREELDRERTEHDGNVTRHSVATRLQSAADKFHQMREEEKK